MNSFNEPTPDNDQTTGGLHRGDFPAEIVNDFPVRNDFPVKKSSRFSGLKIRLLNFLVRRLMGKEYTDKLDLVIKQGLYHAETGAGPYVKCKDGF